MTSSKFDLRSALTPDADALPDIVYLVDLDEQRNVFINKSVQTLLLYSAEDVESMGSDLFPTIIHPEDLPAVGAHYERLANVPDGMALTIEYRVRRKDGVFLWFRSSDAVFKRKEDGAPKLILGSASDITPLKHREAEIELLNHELSHRVQNLFSVVLSLLRAARRSKEDPNVTLAQLEQRILTLGTLHSRTRYATRLQSATLPELIDAFLEDVPEHTGVQLSVADIPILPGMITGLAIFLNEAFQLAFAEKAWPRAPGSLRLEASRKGDTAQVLWIEAGVPAEAFEIYCGSNAPILQQAAAGLGGTFEHDQTGDVLTLTLKFPIRKMPHAPVS